MEAVDFGLLTPAALLGLTVWLLLTGRIIPRSTYDDMLDDRNEWRSAHQVSEAARAELTDSVKELLEHARTTNQVLQALPRVEPPE